jgi:hypothetical protein
MATPRDRQMFMRHADQRLTTNTYDDRQHYDPTPVLKAMDELGLI